MLSKTRFFSCTIPNQSYFVQQFPWYDHIKQIFPKSADIKRDDVVLATSPTYLYNVASLIRKGDKR